MIYFDDLNVFIHLFKKILMKPLLSVAHYFGHWRYSNDYKKIRSLVSWRFVPSEGRQIIKNFFN